MSVFRDRPKPRLSGFRRDLWFAMMLVISALTGVGMFLAGRNLSSEVDANLHRRFEAGLLGLHRAQQVREASLTELARILAKKPRIHAAIEDDALDLLYPSALEELRAVMGAIADSNPANEQVLINASLKAAFCRFLSQDGAVIRPPRNSEVGELLPGEEASLVLDRLPSEEQSGYLLRRREDGSTYVQHFLTVPIMSGETLRPIAALVVGFPFEGLGGGLGKTELQTGVWLGGQLYFPSLGSEAVARLAPELSGVLAGRSGVGSRLELLIEGQRHLLLFEQLNLASLYPPAYGVCALSLAGLEAERRKVYWTFSVAGVLLLTLGLAASRHLAGRFSAPVEELAVESVENLKERQRVEAALETTSAELQRTVRFSSDASHQLNTPVTVLRAGLEELMSRPEFSPEVREEIEQLVHQTYRLGGVIQDLLLLSRMDAGRLRLELSPVNLKQLIEGWLDDFTALPDAFGLNIEAEIPDSVMVIGDARYTSLILQNLIENARKYNVHGGRIRFSARVIGDRVSLVIGNTGPTIRPELQGRIFDRFDRGTMAENIPGTGLGLNLSRELARLHGGDVRLLGSEEGWTEFEVSFRMAPSTAEGSHSQHT